MIESSTNVNKNIFNISFTQRYLSFIVFLLMMITSASVFCPQDVPFNKWFVLCQNMTCHKYEFHGAATKAERFSSLWNIQRGTKSRPLERQRKFMCAL